MRGLVHFNRLLETASDYALRERLSRDTKDLDNMLARRLHEDSSTGHWLWNTLNDAGLLPCLEVPRAVWGQHALVRPASNMGAGAGKAVEYIVGVPSVEHKEKLGDEADKVYAVWLRKYASAPMWTILNAEAKRAIAQLLFQKVEAVAKNVQVWPTPRNLVEYIKGFHWEPPTLEEIKHEAEATALQTEEVS
ncbi:MAG: hypothetical protein Q7R34_01405 [Dehalococcoidia bacterium]|nr:hypothetical protein [Dehalococcoidia bacterium]